MLELCDLTKGLVLVTGPTGSGKSTTLATLIDHINRTRTDHIITIEDPIEFVHENKKCLVNQREVHAHTRLVQGRAARRAARGSRHRARRRDARPRDDRDRGRDRRDGPPRVRHAAHDDGAVDGRPHHRPVPGGPAGADPARCSPSSLKGVISQTLCKKIGGGRVAAYEILICNSAVANLIRERKIFQIYSIMQTSKQQGMMTLNDSLLALVKNKQVDIREAYTMAVNKSEFAGQLAREGLKIGGPDWPSETGYGLRDGSRNRD